MRTLDEESRLSSPEGEGEGASERRFVLSLTQDAPDRDRRQTEGGREGGGVGDSGFWVCSTEAVRNRFIAAVCASRGRPGEALSRLSHPRLPGRRPFPSCGVEVLGSANCHVNHRGIMRARGVPPCLSSHSRKVTERGH